MADDSQNLPPLDKIFAMPDFRRLDAMEKMKFLEAYPDFQALPQTKQAPEKAKFIAQGMANIRMAAEPKTPGFWGTVGEEIGGWGKAIYQEARHPLDTLAGEPMERVLSFGQAITQARGGKYQQAAKSAAKGVLGPTGTAVVGEQLDQFRKASAVRERSINAPDWKEGALQELQAEGYTLAGLIPLLGPAASQAGEEFRQDGPGSGRAWAHVISLLGPDAVGGLLELSGRGLSASLRSSMRVRRTPEELKALDTFRRRAKTGAATQVMREEPLSLGEQTGQRPILRGEQALRETPGAAGIMEEEHYDPQAAELKRQMEESMGKISPTTYRDPITGQPNTFRAGQDADVEIKGTIRQYQADATRRYTDLRTRASQHREMLFNGKHQMVPDPANPGKMISKQVKEPFDMPVAMKPAQRGLLQTYRDLLATHEDWRRNQPAFAVLDRLMSSRDIWRNAMDLEKDLGAIKKLVRDADEGGLIKTEAARTGLNTITQLEKTLADSTAKRDPAFYKDLLKARAASRKEHEVDRLRMRLGGKGERFNAQNIFDNLAKKGDKADPDLRRLKAISPKTTDTIGRAILESYIYQTLETTGTSGGATGTQELFKKWHNGLGSESKRLLYGKNVEELDDLFRGMAMLRPAEGSPTAWRLPVLQMLTSIKTGVIAGAGALVTGHPLVAAAAVAEPFAAMGLANLMARVAVRPGGARAIQRFINLSKTPWFTTGIGAGKLNKANFAAREIVRALQARINVAADERREEQRLAGILPPGTSERRLPPGPRAGTVPPGPPRTLPPAPELAREGPGGVPEGALPPVVPPVRPGDERPTPFVRFTPAVRRTRPFQALPDEPRSAPAPEELPAAPEIPRTAAGVPAGVLRDVTAPERPQRETVTSTLNFPEETERRMAPGAVTTRSFRPLFSQLGGKHHVSPKLLEAIAQAESRGDPTAVSPKGAEGLMQLMPKTSRHYRVDPYDPQGSIDAAAQEMARLLRHYRGNVRLALQGYNWGQGNLDRWRKRGGRMPPETQKYPDRVLRFLNRGGEETAAVR